MSHIKAIISDADGTLVNTIYLIRHGQYEAAVEYMLARGVPRHDIPEYQTYEKFINKAVGGSTRETFEKTLQLLFDKTHNKHFKEINFDELDASLTPIQDRIAPLYVHPFHGLHELFTWSGKTNTKFGIFTSGTRRHVVRNFGLSLPVLGHTELFRSDDIDIWERFQSFIARAKAVYGLPKLAIVTAEDVNKTKPNPEGIVQLIEELEVEPEEVILLGDHSVDMEAANLAGIRAIGVSHGFGTPKELETAGALQVIKDLASLPGLIDQHNSGESPLF
jgi:phosphoglycolate phosphatase-like HAD superfamily hydrolase